MLDDGPATPDAADSGDAPPTDEAAAIGHFTAEQIKLMMSEAIAESVQGKNFARRRVDDGTVMLGVLLIVAASAISNVASIAGLSGEVATLTESVAELDGSLGGLDETMVTLRVSVGILQSYHPGTTRNALLGANAPLPSFAAAVAHPISQVTTTTQWAPDAYRQAAVGLRFVSDSPETSVPVMAMREGVILSVGPDRDPAFPDRFELVLSHPDGSSTYYGILAGFGPSLQRIVDKDGYQSLVGRSLVGGDVLGIAREASPAWLRLGLIDANGVVRSPVENIGGFDYANEVEVGPQF